VATAAVSQGNAVAKDIKLAEMLIARRAAPRRAVPDPGLLADPAIALKSMLRTGETSARSG
jgi:3-phenylpropionate/trans-cinnamate dioxygenase ferredoxin reductase subunit